MRRLAVLTSGGDSPGMNAAVRAVVRSSVYAKCEIYGVQRGYTGLCQGDMAAMQVGDVGDILHRGGTILHSSRCPAFHELATQQTALAHLRRLEIDGLLVIGGDGTFLGGERLAALGLPVVGIPATIDNDIIGTEMAIGFDTAVNTAVACIDRIRDTASSHERTFLIEVMGRTAGWIALWAGLAAGAESIVIPEADFSVATIADRLQRGVARGKQHSIILVAEGAIAAHELATQIEGLTGWETRITVLGHVQRGGSPTAADRLLASRMGAAAVSLLLAGETGCMTALRQGKIVAAPWPSQEPASEKQRREQEKAEEIQAWLELAHKLSI